MSKANLLAILACASSLLAGSALAATPLTRYFPDFPLAVIEAKDLQESIGQTGSFGEDTQVFLGKLVDEAIKSESRNETNLPLALTALSTAAARTLVASIRDIAVAGYSVSNNVEYLIAVRFTPRNFVTTALSKAFNDSLKNTPAAQKLREGNYLAAFDRGFAIGVANNILYLSSNKDLLRGYLKRLGGQALPTLSSGAAYREVQSTTGEGFIKVMTNFAAIAKVYSRTGDLTPRQAAVLRTLNLAGSAMNIVSDGMETRSVSLLNPNGGDAALLKLLTHPAPSSLELLGDLPSTAPSASVLNVDSTGWLEYMQGWLSEAGLSKLEQRNTTDVLVQLKTRLGNEWGVVTSRAESSTAEFANRASFVYRNFRGLPVKSVLVNALGVFATPGPDTYYYAKTQDGQQILNDLEIALTRSVSDRDAEPSGFSATLERTEIGGFDAVMLTYSYPDENDKEIQKHFLHVNKNDTIVIGTDIAKLDGYLTATPLLENEYFAALQIPANVTGVQYIAPLRLSRQEIDITIKNLLEEWRVTNDISASLRKVYGDWYESFAARTLPSYGYSSVDGNKLLSYGKSGFLWNR